MLRSPGVRWLVVALVALGGVAFGADIVNDMNHNSPTSSYGSIGKSNHIARQFVAPASATVTALEIIAAGTQTQGTGDMVMELREDNGGRPGALLAFGSADAGLSGLDVARVELFPTDAFLDGGGAYWAVMYGATHDSWVNWKHSATTQVVMAESVDDGGTWNLFSNRRLTLRVVGTFLEAPVARDDEYFGIEDQTKTYSPAPRINDTPDSGIVELFVTQGPQHNGFFFFANGNFSLTPVADMFGDVTFQYVLDGGELTSNPATVTIHLAPVNDAPSFTPGADQTVAEDSAMTTVNWATAISTGPFNETTQGRHFERVAITSPQLFSVLPEVSPTGQLTFTPAPNQSGFSDVSFVLHDDGGVSNGGVDQTQPQSMRINITQVNDPPSFTPSSDVIAENDEALVTVFRWAQDMSVGVNDPLTQSLSFSVTTDKPELFEVPPAISPGGDLSFDPMADAGGFASVSVVLSDDAADSVGPPLSTAPVSFLIHLKDPPPPDGGTTIIFVDGGTTVIVVESDGGTPPPPRLRGHYACSTSTDVVGPWWMTLVAFVAVWAIRRRRGEARA